MPKSENTFRYVSFSDQVAKVSADYTTVSLALPNTTYDKETFFYEAISKWNDMDYGDDYKTFLDDIPHATLGTYAQLLHHQKEIADTLIRHLQNTDSTSLVTLLELSIAFARDLREDFWPHLWPFFDAVLNVILKAGRRIELFEVAFRCLVVFFKAHWRKITKELRKTFVRFEPLFSNRNEYIRRFAAEAFAFLFRKSPAVKKLTIFLIEKAFVAEDEYTQRGVAALMFNGVKGVHRQFQSRAEQLLSDIVEAAMSIQDAEVRACGIHILEICMKDCVEYTKREFSASITGYLIKSLKARCTKGTDTDVELLCRLLLVWIHEKRGSVFAERKPLFEALREVVSIAQFRPDKNFLLLLSQAISRYSSELETLILQELIQQTVAKLNDPSSMQRLFQFFSELTSLPIFDIWIMDAVGQVVGSLLTSTEEAENAEEMKPILKFYAKHVVERRPYEDVPQGPPVAFFNVSHHSAIRGYVRRVLKESSEQISSRSGEAIGNPEVLCAALVTWPWLVGMSNQSVAAECSQHTSDILRSLLLNEERLSAEAQLILCLAAYALGLADSKRLQSFSVDDILKCLKSRTLDEISLRTALVMVTYTNFNGVVDYEEKFGDFMRALETTIGSPSSRIRVLSLKILRCFQAYLKFDKNEDKKTVFDVLVDTEETRLDLAHYRDRAAQLRKLQYGPHAKYLPLNHRVEVETLILKLVLAQYYERLTVYWPMLREIVESYARGMAVDSFWGTFMAALDEVTMAIRCPNEQDKESEETELDEVYRIVHASGDRKPDHSAFRVQMLKLLGTVADIAERKTKSLAPAFIELYQVEFQGLDSSSRRFEDLTSSSSKEEAAEDRKAALKVEDSTTYHDEEVVEADVDDDEDDIEKADANTVEAKVPREEDKALERRMTFSRKSVANALKAYLSVFAQFNNPKVVYREPEIREIYNHLLLSEDTDLQKGALQCVMAYKHKFMVPYKENLENLLDDKKFRDELVLFTVDEQDSVVDEEHRKELMPYLMKLLYGRFHAHVAVRGSAKRAAIFRFIAGCRPEELDVFFRILFWSFFTVFDDDVGLSETLQRVKDEYDPKKTIPLRRIRSTLNSLSDVLKKLAPSLNEAQKDLLLKIALASGVLIRMGFDHFAEVETYRQKILKGLRLQLFDVLGQVFRAYRHRKFRSEEVNAIFAFVIEPMISSHLNSLEDATMDMPVAPASIARFFVLWTQIPRFFTLLNVPLAKLHGQTAVSVMCNTLVYKGTPKSARNFILQGVLNLLMASDDDEEEADLQIQGLPQCKISVLAKDGAFGTRLVLGHLSRILEFLSANLPQDAKAAAVLPNSYVEVLDRLSPYVESGETGDRFASILLSFVERKQSKGEERTATLLKTVARLIRLVPQPEDYVSRLTPLISSVTSRTARDALIEVIGGLAQNARLRKQAVLLLSLAAELDTWDPQRIQEPDHVRRHEAYGKLIEKYESDAGIDADLLALLAHSHAFTVINTEDISMRSTAANALRQLISHVQASPKYTPEAKTELQQKHFIPLVLKGLRTSVEIARHEFVTTLSHLTTAFPDNAQLRPLVALQSEDKDVDFFETATHIQLHRRQRAFFRLAEQLAEKKVEISYILLHKFIVPIVTPYLLETTSKMSALADQALNLYSEILRHTPWTRYYQCLQYYISQLKVEGKEKAAIRVIVAILDAFHFDVTHCELPTALQKAERPTASKRNVGTSVQGTKRSGNRQEQAPSKDLVAAEEKKMDEEMDEIPEEAQPTTGPVTDAERALTQEQRILRTVVIVVLPQLRQCIRPSNVIHAHKKAQLNKYYNEDEEIMRAPIAVASVKLLKKLPDWVMDQHLHGVVISLMDLLLSRSISVRQSARKTMENVVQALGPKFLPFVVKELKESMDKGFQVHVMIFTVHTLVAALQDVMTTGDIDACLLEIIEVCKTEAFSAVTEEKQAGGVRENVPEAKSNKTADTFAFLGRFVSTGCLGTVLGSMREVIESRPSSDTMRKVGELLRAFSVGLKRNAGIDSQTMLAFAYQTLKTNVGEMITQLDVAKAAEEAEQDEKARGFRPQSCLLLAPEPKRLGIIVKTSVKSKVSVFVEFGLQFLADLLKTRPFDTENSEDVARLDPFVPLLLNALHLKYDKIVCAGLRCLSVLLKFPLPSLKSRLQPTVDRLFVILSDYAGAGTAGNKSVVLELNQLLFKCFTQLIRDSPRTILTPKRIQILLNYVETDILDSHKQATAFNLAKAIVGKKIEDPKILNVMEYLSETAITSHAQNIRTQCRQTLSIFLGAHPQGKDIEKWMTFFINQLEYEYEDGRLSALEMVYTIFENFQPEANDKYAFLAFIKVAVRLTNDQSAKCRKYAALCIQKIVESISSGTFNDIYAATNDWLSSEKDPTRLLALKTLCEFVKANASTTGTKFDDILPRLAGFFNDDAFQEHNEDTLEAAVELLAMLTKHSTEAVHKALAKDASIVLRNIHLFLKCADSPRLQLASCTLLGELLGSSTGKLLKIIERESGIKELCLSLCFQLRTKELSIQLAEQAVKNLIFLMEKIVDVDDYEEVTEKLAAVCWFEIARQPNEATKRQFILKLSAACALKVDGDKFDILSKHFLPLIHREMARKSAAHTDELQQLAMEIGEIFKDKMGDTRFNLALAESQKQAIARTDARKQKEKELAVTDPAAAVLRKQKKHERKNLAKKRKLDELRPYRVAKRKRLQEAKNRGE